MIKRFGDKEKGVREYGDPVGPSDSRRREELASAIVESHTLTKRSEGLRPWLADRRGLTLLELILALSLSIVIVYAIGMAIHLNLRVLDARRSGIEKAQLARAVLQLMANDLRSAVQYETLNFTSVNKMLPGTPPPRPGVPANQQTQSGQIVATSTPGLVGHQYELHVDVSRLPRPDQYEAALGTAPGPIVATDIPSDVKTVSYFLQTGQASLSGGTVGTSGASSSLTSTRTGLIRRELDRAVTSYATELGDTSWLQQSGKLVAPEVAHIEFLYFDGVEWLTEWDSELREGLPLAVDIRMILQVNENATPNLLSPQLQAEPVGNESFYRMVVHLPSADPA